MRTSSNPEEVAYNRGCSQLLSYPQVILIVAAIPLIGIGLFLTPELLIRLGPMQASLTSAIASVRKTTLYEIQILRTLCVTAAVILIAIALGWQRLAATPFITAVYRYEPRTSYTRLSHMRWFNFSFWTMTGVVVTALVYLLYATKFFSDNQL